MLRRSVSTLQKNGQDCYFSYIMFALLINLPLLFLFCALRELRDHTLPIGKYGQRLLNFLEEAEDHYKQLRCFHGFNSRMTNSM